MTWIKIRSFHLFVTYTRAGQVLTRCGRRISGTSHEIVDNLPAGKSCETCLRLATRDADPAEPTNDAVTE